MLWKKDAEVEPWVIRFTVGEDYRWDQLLLPFDIAATKAHVAGLVTVGVLEPGERERIDRSLDILADRVENGEIVVSPEQE
ncbi:MAG TPA: argininosuccinate lyase, partial [Rhodothermia bacterium]|nr:argininosuccinate lyase [Rhodothermia bacterium]